MFVRLSASRSFERTSPAACTTTSAPRTRSTRARLSEIEPWTTYRQQGTLNFIQEASRHTLELFPQLERARILRSWAGLCDISPDYSPILGETEVDGFSVSAGWGTYGFKAAPIVGRTMAELVATGKTPELIQPFALERFYRDRLVSELGAAAVSH